MQRFEGIWHKGTLLPCWILQFLAAGALGAVATILLVMAVYVIDNKSEIDTDYSYMGLTADEIVKYSGGIGGLYLVFAGAIYIFNFVELFLYIKRALNPIVALVFACFKSLFAIVFMTLSLMAATQGVISGFGFVLSAMLLCSSISQLLVSSKLTHQKRKGTLPGHEQEKPNAEDSIEAEVPVYTYVPYFPSLPKPPHMQQQQQQQASH